jgi:ABC-type Fe3+-hydroxamate transport system substrate-binding protein
VRSGVSGHPFSRGRVPFVRLSLAIPTLTIVLAACAGDGSNRPIASQRRVDDFGDSIAVGAPPARIVSLNPAMTELLFALGAGSRLVGRTHWDEWPAEALAVPDLGPGVRPNVEAVLAARPDLVVLYASADNRAAATRLRAAGIRTLSLKVDRIEHFERAAAMLGLMLGDTARARSVTDSVRATLDAVAARTRTLDRPRVLWPVDVAPVIAIGAGSFLTQLIEIAGGANAYADMAAVSPQLSLEDVHARDPDIILANPTLAARIRSEAAWSGLRAVRENRVLEADEVLMGRPSVRMGEAAVALARLLHPEVKW